MSKYQESVRTYQRLKANLRRLVTNAVVDKIGISHQLWNRSTQFYTSNSVLGPQLYSIVNFIPTAFMKSKQGYNEMKKHEVYAALLDIHEMQEDFLVALLEKYQNGSLEAKDVPMALDEQLTKMYDDIWMEKGNEEEEIFNEFFDHKIPFNARYVEGRENSWRRLAKKLSE